jgi:predicted nucleic acid-binding protein
MIVIADTSPVNYLILIRQIHLLKALYSRTLIPPAVLSELKHPLAPQAVKEWAASPPPWIEIVEPRSTLVLHQLDPGENEAIWLAMEVRADLILIDDQAGRQEALRRGLNVAGTLSVLDEADRVGLVSFDVAINELAKTSFRVSPTVLLQIKQRRSP